MRIFLLALLLSGCTSSLMLESNDSAICLALGPEVNSLAKILIEQQEKTPDEVIIQGTKVIKGFDAGC